MNVSKADLDMGDVLLEAARLHVAGDVLGAGMRAIPAIRQEPVTAVSFLTSMLARAVHEYAAVTKQSPLEAFDALWSKPKRNSRGGLA